MTKTKERPAEKKFDDSASTWSRTVRETIESVVIAFVLAFLFRTFEAEAFVIPTGSMAPTLMGRHMDLVCPECGYRYRVGANNDADDAPAFPTADADCTCPNCRYTIDFARLTPAERNQYPYYNGDRILVSKFAYDFTQPKRWDVIVFKFPEDAKTNYIKRLVGLPGEVIRIRTGEIAYSTDAGKTFRFAHKSPAKTRAAVQIVYDNNYVFEPFLAQGWPARWQSRDTSWANSARPGGKPDPKLFETSGKPSGADGSGTAWLRYYNFVPTQNDWDEFANKQRLDAHPPITPITDFIPYDTSNRGLMGGIQHPTVTDLAVECELHVKGAAGKVVFELLKKGRRFGCQLDLGNGNVQLTLPNRKPSEQPTATTTVSRAGTFHVFFANVDHQLTLLIDGKPIAFDKPTAYDELQGGDGDDGEQPGPDGDFSPVGIGSEGAAISVAHLHVFRDIYYTYEGGRLDHPWYQTVFPIGPRIGRKALAIGLAFPPRGSRPCATPAPTFTRTTSISSSARISFSPWATTAH